MSKFDELVSKAEVLEQIEERRNMLSSEDTNGQWICDDIWECVSEMEDENKLALYEVIILIAGVLLGAAIATALLRGGERDDQCRKRRVRNMCALLSMQIPE